MASSVWFLLLPSPSCCSFWHHSQTPHPDSQKMAAGSSLLALWLRPCVFNTVGTSSIPGCGTRVPHALWLKVNKMLWYYKKRCFSSPTSYVFSHSSPLEITYFFPINCDSFILTGRGPWAQPPRQVLGLGLSTCTELECQVPFENVQEFSSEGKLEQSAWTCA